MEQGREGQSQPGRDGVLVAPGGVPPQAATAGVVPGPGVVGEDGASRVQIGAVPRHVEGRDPGQRPPPVVVVVVVDEAGVLALGGRDRRGKAAVMGAVPGQLAVPDPGRQVVGRVPPAGARPLAGRLVLPPLQRADSGRRADAEVGIRHRLSCMARTVSSGLVTPSLSGLSTDRKDTQPTREIIVALQVTAIMLGVKDLARSKKFYGEGLGGTIEKDYPTFVSVSPGSRARSLALYERGAAAQDAGVSAEGSGFSGFSFHYIVTSRQTVDEVIASAVAAGSEVVKAAAAAQWGGYSGDFSDPDRHLWKGATSHLTA